MIDIIALAVSAAQQILTGVLTDQLTGQRAARKREIERSAREAAVASEPRMSKEDIEVLTKRIVAEVRYLVHEHPDMEWRSESVRVLPGIPSDTRESSGATNTLLRERVERLNQIAHARYERILVDDQDRTPPTHPAQRQPSDSDGPDANLPATVRPVIVAVHQYEVEPSNYWRSRLEGMKSSVKADRRSSIETRPPEFDTD